MVVTSNRFTAGAIEFAASTSCELVDREELARWILEFRGDGISSCTREDFVTGEVALLSETVPSSR